MVLWNCDLKYLLGVHEEFPAEDCNVLNKLVFKRDLLNVLAIGKCDRKKLVKRFIYWVQLNLTDFTKQD